MPSSKILVENKQDTFSSLLLYSIFDHRKQLYYITVYCFKKRLVFIQKDLVLLWTHFPWVSAQNWLRLGATELDECNFLLIVLEGKNPQIPVKGDCCGIAVKGQDSSKRGAFKSLSTEPLVINNCSIPSGTLNDKTERAVLFSWSPRHLE